jgi:hypothetical protein
MHRLWRSLTCPPFHAGALLPTPRHNIVCASLLRSSTLLATARFFLPAPVPNRCAEGRVRAGPIEGARRPHCVQGLICASQSHQHERENAWQSCTFRACFTWEGGSRMPQAPSRFPVTEPHVWAAWQAQVAALARHAPLHRQFLGHERAFFPRFAAPYTRLRACPRRVRRALRRQWRRPLAGLAVLLTLGGSPALAATIHVDGACTLVKAVQAANTDTARGAVRRGVGPTPSCCRQGARRP